MRADRLLSIVYLLRARGPLRASELAAALEVSLRTILRDVEALSTAGVGIYSLRGRGGGIALLPGYRTDVSALSEQEASALFAAIAAPGADALGLGDALTSALRKIMAALPESRRPAAELLAERIVIDTGGWLPRHEEPLLGIAQEAVLTGRKTRISYQGRKDDAPSVRTVDPYGLLHSGGVWYLVAGHRGQPRFYRLARVGSMQVLEKPSVRPAGLDLRRLWNDRRAGYRSQFSPLAVELWVRRSRLGDLAGSAASAAEKTDAASAQPGEEWIAVRAEFGDITHAWQVVRGLEEDAIVIRPDALRQKVLSAASSVLDTYARWIESEAANQLP